MQLRRYVKGISSIDRNKIAKGAIQHEKVNLRKRGEIFSRSQTMTSKK